MELKSGSFDSNLKTGDLDSLLFGRSHVIQQCRQCSLILYLGSVE